MRRAGNRRAYCLRHRLAVGADDHRHLHLFGVGAGVSCFKVDDVAEEDFSFVELVTPDDNGLEGERALAQAGDHGFAAGLNALGDGDFTLAREQLDRAHLAQIHAHGIVGTFGRFFLLGGRQRLRLRLDDLGAGILIVIVGFVGRLLVGVGLFGLDDVDAHFIEHRIDVLDLVGGHLAGRHDFVDLVDGDVAALLGGLDHLLDAGIGEIEKRQRRVQARLLPSPGLVLFLSPASLLPCSPSASPGPSWPSRARFAALPGARPKRAAPARRRPEIRSSQCLRNPLSSD